MFLTDTGDQRLMQTDPSTCEHRPPLKTGAISVAGVNGCYGIIGDSN